MKEQFFYVYSYGSNLLLNRISSRVKSVKVMGTYELRGYNLIFNKLSKDGSTKANIELCKESTYSVWGVIHRIDIEEKEILDRYEGLGYGYEYLTLGMQFGGKERMLHSYVSVDDKFLAKGKPFDWYLNYVIAGAIENEFPEEYIARLKQFETIEDSDKSRSTENFDILNNSGVKW